MSKFEQFMLKAMTLIVFVIVASGVFYALYKVLA